MAQYGFNGSIRGWSYVPIVQTAPLWHELELKTFFLSDAGHAVTLFETILFLRSFCSGIGVAPKKQRKTAHIRIYNPRRRSVYAILSHYLPVEVLRL